MVSSVTVSCNLLKKCPFSFLDEDNQTNLTICFKIDVLLFLYIQIAC